MKNKGIIYTLVTVLLTACICSATYASDEDAPGQSGDIVPSIYWDFKDYFPQADNLVSFFPDKQYARSEEGNIVFSTTDGDKDRNHLQVFINTDNKNGNSMADFDVFVLRFKFKDMTYAADYGPNCGYIGYDWEKGSSGYLKPSYIKTNDWQVMYLDYSGNDYTGDAWYFVWFWYEAANFPADVEIDYIASFADLNTAYAYVESRGHNTEPTPITDAVTTAVPVPETEVKTEPLQTSAPSVSTKVETDNTNADTVINGTDTKSGVDSPVKQIKTVIHIIVAAAAVAVVTVIIIVVLKAKKKK